MTCGYFVPSMGMAEKVVWIGCKNMEKPFYYNSKKPTSWRMEWLKDFLHFIWGIEHGILKNMLLCMSREKVILNLIFDFFWETLIFDFV